MDFYAKDLSGERNRGTDGIHGVPIFDFVVEWNYSFRFARLVRFYQKITFYCIIFNNDVLLCNAKRNAGM